MTDKKEVKETKEAKPEVEEIHTKADAGETELYRAMIKSYRFDQAWKERGEGDVILAKSDKGVRVL